jgi:predicted ester cyclase
MGLPPTGKSIRVRGISIYRIAEGQLREAWVQYDGL